MLWRTTVTIVLPQTLLFAACEPESSQGGVHILGDPDSLLGFYYF